jgi:hypothetical protein
MKSILNENDPLFQSNQDASCRRLIEQLYAGSVERYGPESEQARLLERLLSGDSE